MWCRKGSLAVGMVRIICAMCERLLFRISVGVAVTVVSVLCARGGVLAAEADDGSVADLQAIQNSFQALAEKVAPCVVTLRSAYRVTREATTRKQRIAGPTSAQPWRRVSRAGSGAIIRSDGMILTSEHLVYQADQIVVHLHDNREVPAAIVQTDPRSDLAVLRIDATGLRAVTFGDASTLRQGHLVFPFGNPFGVASKNSPSSMNWGVVSALGRTLPMLSAAEGRYYADLIETTATIIPGHSGGPLFNIRGEVVGVSTAIRTRSGRSGGSEGLGLFVPVNASTRRIIEALMKGQDVEYGLLGVVFPSFEMQSAEGKGAKRQRGALISAVEPDSPAEAVNLRSGDRIVRYGGRVIRDPDHLIRIVGGTRPGRQVEVVYRRKGKVKTATVTIGRREPSERGHGGIVHWRGLTLRPLRTDSNGSMSASNGSGTVQGIIVVGVRPNSQADLAGCRRGLVLDRVGRYSVRTLRQFRNVVRRFRDKAVEVAVRGGIRFEFQAQ